MLYDIDGSFCYEGKDKAYQMASALVTLVWRELSVCVDCLMW